MQINYEKLVDDWAKEIDYLKAENKGAKELIEFLVWLLVSTWYDGEMPTEYDENKVKEESKKWLDEEIWHNYFSI